jgi:hypothetical protein
VIIVIAVVGLAFLGLPGALGVVGRRTNPRLWTKLCALALLSGAVIFELAALVATAPAAFLLVGRPGAAHACELLLGTTFPGGWALSLAALAVAVLLPSLAWRALGRARGVARSISMGLHHDDRRVIEGQFELHVLASVRQVAFSLPGRGGQIVVSQGIVDALSPGQFDALCAHEAAHLRLVHSRYVQLAQVMAQTFALWPPTRVSVTTLRHALERWADEQAVGESWFARSDLRTALLTVAQMSVPDEIAAFSSLDGVFDRVNALDVMPSRLSVTWWCALLVPGLVLGTSAAASLLWWGQHAYCMIGMVGNCLR